MGFSIKSLIAVYPDAYFRIYGEGGAGLVAETENIEGHFSLPIDALRDDFDWIKSTIGHHEHEVKKEDLDLEAKIVSMTAGI